MILRTAKQGPRAGSQFWGCSGYPACKSTQAV
jgi:ssDNA-binding Zn-finger/Zn-ribbon topoisomerase 1